MTSWASWAVRYLEEFQKYHPFNTKNKKWIPSRWECPPRGRLKVNVDGAFREDLQQGGIGVVVRDEDGHCIAAFARSMPFALSALKVEAEAARAGLLIAIHEGLSHIDLESDCAVLVTALTTQGLDCSEIGLVVEDCKEYLSTLSSAKFRHIYRETHSVAHRLAHLASSSFIDDLWLEETGSIIEDVLSEDICKLARGSGSSSPLMYNHLY